jgi:hypothetical protein
VTTELVAVDTGGALDERIGWQLVQQAEAMLEQPETAPEAEHFMRQVHAVEDAMRWARLSAAVCVAMGRVRLRAEVRWGELLGDPKPGRRAPADSEDLTKAERVRRAHARRLARQVLADPDAFERYVNADRDEPPTRVGALRATKPPEEPRRSPDIPSRNKGRNIKGRQMLLVAFTLQQANAKTGDLLLKQLREDWLEGKVGSARVIGVERA